jgi:hypothetical protein
MKDVVYVTRLLSSLAWTCMTLWFLNAEKCPRLLPIAMWCLVLYAHRTFWVIAMAGALSIMTIVCACAYTLYSTKAHVLPHPSTMMKLQQLCVLYVCALLVSHMTHL